MRYDRIASLYDLVEWPLENLVHRAIRRKLFAQVPVGVRFLEVGVGTGQNLELYPPGADATAIDLSPRMLARAGARAARRGIAVRLELGDIQHLHFADRSFDAVVSQFGLMFFALITPVGWVMRLRGRDALKLRLDPSAHSYWVDRRPPGPRPESFKQQF